MKRIAFWLAILMLMTTFAGCGMENYLAQEPNNEYIGETEPIDEDEELEEYAVFVEMESAEGYDDVDFSAQPTLLEDYPVYGDMEESDQEDGCNWLYYESTEIAWTTKRKKNIRVSGWVSNASEQYDVVDLKDLVVVVVDVRTGDIIDYKFLTGKGGLPHGKRTKVYFTVKNVPSGHDPANLAAVLTGSMSYFTCPVKNCSVCEKFRAKRNAMLASSSGGSSSGKVKCKDCGGSGHSSLWCTYCKHTGEDPAYTATAGSVLHAFAKKDCPVCNGTGYQKCTTCRGNKVV